MALKHLPENTREEARAWNLQLGVPGFKYADLNRVRRLEALDKAFVQTLQETEPELAARFQRYRDTNGADIERLHESELLIQVAPHVGAFVARLFQIGDAHAALCERLRGDQVVFEWKRQFIERRVLKSTAPSAAALAQMDPVELEFAYREVVDAVLPDGRLTSDPERELAVVTTTLQARIDSKSDPDACAEAKARLTTVEAWVAALGFHP